MKRCLRQLADQWSLYCRSGPTGALLTCRRGWLRSPGSGASSRMRFRPGGVVVLLVVSGAASAAATSAAADPPRFPRAPKAAAMDLPVLISRRLGRFPPPLAAWLACCPRGARGGWSKATVNTSPCRQSRRD